MVSTIVLWFCVEINEQYVALVVVTLKLCIMDPIASGRYTISPSSPRFLFDLEYVESFCAWPINVVKFSSTDFLCFVLFPW